MSTWRHGDIKCQMPQWPLARIQGFFACLV